MNVFSLHTNAAGRRSRSAVERTSNASGFGQIAAFRVGWRWPFAGYSGVKLAFADG